MKEVWINHKPVDFGNAQTQQKVQPGCGIIEADKEEEEQEDEMDEMIGNCKNFGLTKFFNVSQIFR